MTSIDPVRGEIWKVRFDRTYGQEIGKTRPAIVMNKPQMGRKDLRMVAPVTTGRPQFTNLAWMTRIRAESTTGLDHDSFVDSSQIQPVSLGRFVERLGVVADADTLEQIAKAVAVCISFGVEQRKGKRKRRR